MWRCSLVLALSIGACAGEETIGGSDAAPEDAGAPDADGGTDPVDVGYPVMFEQCPEGWAPAISASGIGVCDPWPGTAPVTLTPCPEGWVERPEPRGWIACDPWPGTSPVEWACPPSWRVFEENGAGLCHPYPAEGEGSCAAGEAHFPGEPACAPIGDPCPAGDFPENLPADRQIIYVRAGASGGDGSQAQPFGELRAATASVSAGAIIAVGRGEYFGEVVLPAGVTLWGACVEGTVLRSTQAWSGSAREGVVTVPAGEVTIRNLQFGESARPGLVVKDFGARSQLIDVVVRRAGLAGIFVDRGGVLDAASILVEDIQPIAGISGVGISVTGLSEASVRRAIVTGAAYTGVSVNNSQLIIEDALIRDTVLRYGLWATSSGSVTARRVHLSGNGIGDVVADSRSRMLIEDLVITQAAGAFVPPLTGPALGLYTGATATVSGALIDVRRDSGALAGYGETMLYLRDAVVRNRREGVPGSGLGLNAGATGAMDVRRAVVEHSGYGGVFVGQEGKLTAQDLIVRDNAGIGLYVDYASVLELSRVYAARNHGSGVRGLDLGTIIRASDLVVEDTNAQAGAVGEAAVGTGLGVSNGAVAEIERARFSRSRVGGIYAAFDGTSVSLRDVVIEGTRPEEMPGLGNGFGLGIEIQATADVRRVLISDNRHAGVYVNVGARLTLEDAIVEGTRWDEGSYVNGQAVLLGHQANATIRRLLASDNRGQAVVASEREVVLTLEDAVLRDTDSFEPEGQEGGGLQVAFYAQAEARRVHISSVRGTGISAYWWSVLNLEDVLVENIAAPRHWAEGLPSPEASAAVMSTTGSTITAGRFVLTQSHACGAYVGPRAVLDLYDGLVSRSAVGACVDRDYDLQRLQNRVRYEDNEVDVEVTNLPVPELATQPPER